MLGGLPAHSAKREERMLYRVQKGDIVRASKVLADAFQRDPLWNKIYEGDPNIEKRFQAFFEGGVRYCMKYGEVYAPLEGLEGVIGLVPGEYADMNWWRAIRSGTMSVGMRMGLKTAKKMGTIFKLVVKDRREHMAGCSYLYVLVFGVSTGLQGKGFGRKLIDAAIEKSEREGLHLYLETETEENVKMYEHFGFRLLKKITLPVVDLPMWEMVREPKV
jgi:ribosomal protein S18 acetylase RimI-like enzyme